MRLKIPLQPCVLLLTILTLILLSASCTNPPAPEPSSTALLANSPTPAQPSPTQVPPTATPTPEPLAARVDGAPLSLAEYEAELTRYLDSTAVAEQAGTDLATENAQQIVLDELINRLLLAQAARESGYTVDESQILARIEALVNELGSEQVLNDWISTNNYTAESFRADLERQMTAVWMRNQILAEVPATTYQIHARQILLYNDAEAQAVLLALQNGDDFGALAAEYDPAAQGDIGWFPRGYLLYPQLDEVFDLQPGDFSGVIETELGFHIVQVLEVESERPLEPGARLALQKQALQTWLENRRQEREIEVYLP